MTLSASQQAPAEVFLLILSYLEKHHHFHSARFLQRYNLSIEMLHLKGTKVDSSILHELLDEAIHVSQDSGLLFKFSRLVTPSNLGVLGYLMLHSSSIEDAITKLCRYYALIGKSLKPIFFPNEGKLTLLICKDGSVSHLEKYSAEIHLSALLHLLNTIIPTPISPKKTTFRHAKPTHADAYRHVFGDAIHFDEVENALYFDTQHLSTKTSFHDPRLVELFEKEAESSLGMSLHGNLIEQVKGLILIGTGELDVSLESIALKMNMHPRTLQKRLQHEEHSFLTLVTEVRQKLAIHYLHKGVDTATIASYLGYAEVSPFFRAFKKWYGMSPKMWLDNVKRKSHE